MVVRINRCQWTQAASGVLIGPCSEDTSSFQCCAELSSVDIRSWGSRVVWKLAQLSRAHLEQCRRFAGAQVAGRVTYVVIQSEWPPVHRCELQRHGSHATLSRMRPMMQTDVYNLRVLARPLSTLARTQTNTTSHKPAHIHIPTPLKTHNGSHRYRRCAFCKLQFAHDARLESTLAYNRHSTHSPYAPSTSSCAAHRRCFLRSTGRRHGYPHVTSVPQVQCAFNKHNSARP